ncbi:MAG: HD domain-containing protein [Candidatus Saccharibacteria bacterium]|nr:HD domain-containing protein [Candidatus Saccharibacteria bacterium]
MLDKAIIFATNAHSGSFRKGTNLPYIVHPMEVASIVSTMTDDRSVMAAAMLHDTVEDTNTTIDDIRREFGDKVADLVSSESENKREDLPSGDTWKIRKQETVARLKNESSKEAKMIALGDKLSNMRAIWRDYATIGDKLWERFNQSDPHEILWYYSAVAESLVDLNDTFVHKEYVGLINEMRSLIK